MIFHSATPTTLVEMMAKSLLEDKTVDGEPA
jgi:hypothetical protein